MERQDRHIGKPLLRGWSHAVAALVSVGALIMLFTRSQGDLVRAVAALTFGVTMVLTYSISATYHIGNWTARGYVRIRAFDHANIFLLIAGTYTPITVIVLDGWLRVATLITVWAMAVAGVTLVLLRPYGRRTPRALFYVGMGWMGIIPLPSLMRTLPFEAMLTLMLGGLLYSLGALVYIFRRPNPLPRFFGFHEVFHLFVIGGNTAFLLAIWRWVLPFGMS